MAKRALTFSPSTIYWAMIGLLCVCSLFFVVNVEQRRRSWRPKASKQLSLTKGEMVRVVKAIDGDEVSAARGGDSFVIRILGIKCFNPSINEAGLSSVGKACRDSLNRLVVDKNVAVEFTQLKQDRRKRVLAYLDLSGKDVGLTLVQQGYAMVYTRYAFAREKVYLAAEQAAKAAGRGLWNNAKAVARAEALRTTWDTQRHD